MENKITLSIIIVHYKVERELMDCISSIVESKPKIKYEIIVVDNDLNSKIGKQLKNNFPDVRYIRNQENLGFGGGNNLGSKMALGEYLFFLNPDTVVKNGAIDTLLNFSKANSESGMVAPLLFSPSGEVYPNQGSSQYGFKSAIVINSFINKLFPNNPISRRFFHKDWDRKSAEEFDVVPGTAFMISKDLFKRVGMFDENFFLYFEEYDLAKRIAKLGYKNYIVPNAKVMHIWEASTKKRKNIDKIFAKSRYLFFKKNYGTLFALIINAVSNFGKYEFAFGLILVLSIFFGLSKIRELMTFIGDQGWFYLSARDLIADGQIPLVGIASSHPWLHQGAFWTYLLVPFLWLFNFDPVSGAYLSIIFGILSVVGIYFVGSALFGKRVGLITCLLYATSPLAVYYMRFPYHTSPIPFFVIALIFSFYKITQNKFNYFPLAVFLLGILYNFEISSVVLWGVLATILMHMYFKNKKVLRRILNKEIIFGSFFSFTIPLLPMILYDVRNGLPQTLKFVVWIFYRIISLFGYNPNQEFSVNKIIDMFNFLFNNFRKLIFAQSNIISLAIFLLLVMWAIYIVFKKIKASSYILIFLLIFIPAVLIILNQTPSDAYLPIFFPAVMIFLALFLDFMMSKKRVLVLAFILVIIIVVGNINFILKNDFSFDKENKFFTLEKRLQAANRILDIAQKNEYNLRGKGPGSEFESFTMNYEYLTWWLGHAPSKTEQRLIIYVSESQNGIRVERQIK